MALASSKHFSARSINGGERETMRCRIHISDPGAGVCAACLRERLTALAAAVANASDTDFSPDLRRHLGRSLSSDTVGLRPAAPHLGRAAVTDTYGGDTKRRAKFSFLSSLLGRSREREPDPVSRRSSRSRSWLSSMIRGRGRRKNKNVSRNPLEERVVGRGMSPAEKEVTTDFESDSGYQTDPSGMAPRYASSPMRRSEASHYTGRSRNKDCRFKGLALCFSPLMRPSPGNQRNQVPSDIGFSGELQGTFNTQRNRYGASSVGGSSFLGPNRSRKIADFGKAR